MLEKRVPGLGRKCLLPPTADEGVDSLDVQASALLRGRGLPYFFTVLQQ